MKKFIVLMLISSFIILLVQAPLSVLAQSSEPECWAVIAGISNYQLINDLDYPDDGARELYEKLRPVWGEDNIRLLLDEECRKSDIMAALDWLAERDDADDTVLFYFAGHGDSGYILPYNANDESTWIASDELDSKLDNLEAEKIVTILDTCYAGQFEESLHDDGRLVLMSSRSTETSVETSTLEYGVFTYFILVALEQFDDADTNHDCILSAEEIFQYAEQKTVSYTAPLSIAQHPVLSDDYPGELGLLAKFIFRTNLDIGSILTVDGEIITSAVPWFIWCPGSMHEIEVSSFFDEGENTRLAFVSWDDGITSASRTVQSGIYAANYQRQYLLTIESAYSEPEGAGWYDEGSTASISISSVTEPTIRRHFVGWSGDYTGNEKTASFIVSTPKAIKANWRSEYLLTIESAYGEPKGAGWYDEGTPATISVPESFGVLVRHFFTGWSGDMTAGAPTAMLMVDSPITVTAEWRTDYTYLILLIVGSIVIAGILIGIIIMVMWHRKKAV